MIQVCVAASAEARFSAARDFVLSLPPATEVAIVAATRAAADAFARSVAASAGATFGWHRFTLAQLAWRLAAVDLAARGLAPLSALGAEAMAARATFEALPQLRYFHPVAQTPGFAPALASTLQDLRMAAVHDADFGGVLAREPAAADLAILLRGYQEQLAAGALADRAELLSAARQAAGNGPPLAQALLALDLKVHTLAERAFLAALAEKTPSVLVTIPEGDQRTREAFAVATPLPAAPATHSALGRLRQFLFVEQTPPPGRPDSDVQFFSAPGETRECVEVARRILQEARGGVRFDQMAVLTRSPETYAAVLEAALERAGIPAYFARGAKRPDPAGRAFLALLGCAVQGLSARAFAEYLSLGQVPDPDGAGAPPEKPPLWVHADEEVLGKPLEIPAGIEAAAAGENQPVLAGTLRAPWKWEELLVEAAVIGGYDRWERRLRGLAGTLRLKLRELGSEESDSARRAALERDLQQLGHLQRFALPLIQRLARLPEEASWGVWLDELEPLAATALRGPERVLAVLAEMRPMSGMGPVSLNEVRAVLHTRLATLPQDPPESPFGRVFIGALDQVRGRSFEVVFVPGMAERLFPQPPREDPLLLDKLRADLSAPLQGVWLATQDQRAGDERLLLRLAAGAARRRLYLSYPRMEMQQSRPRVPSFYALDVMRAVTGRVPDYRDLEREAAQAAQARLAWPAPADPQAAIDESEHDLAVLQQRAQARVPGGARFLLELHPHLARSLRARYDRWERRRWLPADGLISERAAIRELLAAHGLRERPYSVSSLQTFAACPYRFLLTAIYRLRTRQDPVPLETLDPQTRGAMFHKAQAEMIRYLIWAKKYPVAEKDLPSLLETLWGLVEQVARQYEEELAPAIPRVWADAVEGVHGDLRGWLAHLAAEGGPWQPVHVEYGFGRAAEDGLDPASSPVPARLAGGFQLRGAIDLIERHAETGELRITDHKTGRNNTEDILLFHHGESLQPSLYALAAEALLGQRVSGGRLFFATAAGGYTEHTVKLDDQVRKAAGDILQCIEDFVQQAFLPAAPRPEACEWCDFREVCGPYEEVRTAKKDPEHARLEDLRWLRDIR